MIASLKAQAFSDWYLFVADDGSNADEKVVIREIIEKSGLPHTFFRLYPTIRFAAAQNFLFAHHESEYVAILRSGEVLVPDALQTAINTLESRNVYASVDVGCLVLRRSAILEVHPDQNLLDGMFVNESAIRVLLSTLERAGFVHEIGLVCEIRPRNNNIFYTDEERYFHYRHIIWHDFVFRTQGFFNGLILFIAHAWLSIKIFFRAPTFVVGMFVDSIHMRKALRVRRSHVHGLAIRNAIAPSRHIMAPEYDIAVVTVAHNDLYPESLLSLKKAIEATSLKVGVVIVDNASQKFHADQMVYRYIPYAHVLLREKNFGFGHSSNLGAKAVRARYYMFLNPDTLLVDEKIFEKLHQFMTLRADAGLVAPRIFYYDGRLQETCRRLPKWFVPFIQRTGLRFTDFGKRYNSSFTMADYDHEVVRDVDWVQGSAMMIDANVFHALGGWDERFFMYFEDIDLCRRVHALGKKVYYVPEVTLRHAHGKESARIPNFVKNLVQNRIARAHIVSWIKYLLKWRFR